jgi:hypothetical protein
MTKSSGALQANAKTIEAVQTWISQSDTRLLIGTKVSTSCLPQTVTRSNLILVFACCFVTYIPLCKLLKRAVQSEFHGINTAWSYQEISKSVTIEDDEKES